MVTQTSQTGASAADAPDDARQPNGNNTTECRVAVLVSGSGSNLQSLIDTWKHQPRHAHLSLVLSNRPNVYALTRAAEAGVPHSVLDHTHFETRNDFDAALHAHLKAEGINFIVLAGFMRILSPEFLSHWHGKIINIHPSLLPAYRGLNTHARVLADQQKAHGCTIHWVEPELDAGPIIAQARMAISTQETPEQLHQRVQQLEHKLYPLALNWVLKQEQQELPNNRPVFIEESDLRTLTEQTLNEHYNSWIT